MKNRNTITIRKWSEIYKRNVFVPSEGRNIGVVEDFYFKPGTNAVYALLVHMRIEGNHSLPVTGIASIGEAISIRNAQMLTRALPPLPQGQQLQGGRVLNEDGTDVGTISDIWLGVDFPEALYIAGFEVKSGHTHRARYLDADEVLRYENQGLVVYKRTAKQLR